MSGQAKLVKVSATKLSTWQDCPRKFFFTYVQRMPRGTWAHLSYGNAIHLALRDAYGDEDSAGLSAGALVDRHWRHHGFRDGDQSDHWRKEATQLVAKYLEQGAGRHVQSTERTLGARTERIVIDARIDRIDVRESEQPEGAGPEELVIVDYKTGKRPLTETDARSSMALAFYVLAARQSLRRLCNTVELHHLPTGDRVVWQHDEQSLSRHIERAESIAVEMQQAVDSWEGSDQSPQTTDALFAPAPGPLCGFCDVHSSCSAAGAPARDSWAGLGDLAES